MSGFPINNPNPGILWNHPNPIACPSGIWVPHPWNTVNLDNAGINPYGSVGGQTPAATTIAALSNNVALPTATINVASTAGFTSTGFIVITISGVDTVVSYTGTSGGNSFTGCASDPLSGAISTGTMLTSQVVKQAFVIANLPVSTLWSWVASVEWTANATGFRAVRIRSDNAPFNFVSAYGCSSPGSASEPTYSQVSSQPASGLYRVEAYQSSGGVLNTSTGGGALATPSMQAIGFYGPP